MFTSKSFNVLRVVVLFHILIVVSYYQYYNIPISDINKVHQKYAIFGCSTPNTVQHSQKNYNYAFYLPLTALAWRRVNFRSIVLISGNESEWKNDTNLSYILSSLVETEATVIFLETSAENRVLVSQVSRLFACNLQQLDLEADDYLLTTDADLWPFSESHYEPRKGYTLVLVHSQCCEWFTFAKNLYRMLPMSNIGTTVETWRQIMNYNRRVVADDSEKMLQYLEQAFTDENIRNEVDPSSSGWYMDQKLVTMRIAKWIDMHPAESIYRVSDRGFQRIDRRSFRPSQISKEEFLTKYDSHLPKEGYLPQIWNETKYLVDLMFGRESSEAEWCNNYARTVYEKFSQS